MWGKNRICFKNKQQIQLETGFLNSASWSVMPFSLHGIVEY